MNRPGVVEHERITTPGTLHFCSVSFFPINNIGLLEDFVRPRCFSFRTVQYFDRLATRSQGGIRALLS